MQPKLAWFTFTMLSFVVLLSLAPVQECSAQSDPMDLIDRFCEARKEIKTCTQTWEIETTLFSDGGSIKEVYTRNLSLLFDRGKIKCTTTRPMAPNRNPVVILNEDRNLMYSHDDTDGGVIDDRSQGSVEMLFDPRVVGIVRTLTPAIDADRIFPTRDRGQAIFIDPKPDESIAGTVIGVEYELLNGSRSTFWVSSNSPEQVMAFYDGTGKHRWISTYAEGDPLPITSRHLVVEESGEIRRSTVYRRVKGEYGVSIDPTEFTVKGLDLNVGEPLIDASKDEILGVWNGNEIVTTLEQEMAFPPPPSTGEPLPREWTRVRVVVMWLSFMAAVGLGLLYLQLSKS